MKQRVKPAEIIIVDDCSSDNTFGIIKEYFGDVPNLRILMNSSNSGQSYSRNIAASHCSADVIIIFDDDDTSSPFRAEKHLEMHEGGSDISFVSSTKKYSDSYEIDCINDNRTLIKLEPNSLFKRLILGQHSHGIENTWVPASTSSFRREYFLEIGGYDIEMRRLEDADIVIKAALVGCVASWSSQILVTRKSTLSPNKGGVIEVDFEKRVLLKYQGLLTKIELSRALTLIEIRNAYFSKRYFRLFWLVCRHPSFLIGPHSRIVAFAKRLTHERRQKN